MLSLLTLIVTFALLSSTFATPQGLSSPLKRLSNPPTAVTPKPPAGPVIDMTAPAAPPVEGGEERGIGLGDDLTGQIREYNFLLDNSVVAPDGFPRAGVIVNGQFPGTTIRANKGDFFRINVDDQLVDPDMRRSVTVHWHGIFQNKTAFQDGVAQVTQCPIAPGNEYPYFFSTDDQSGTFWYHSHLSTQYIDGLRGAIIIYDPEDPFKDMYDVDDLGTIIQLGDWYHIPTIPLLEEFYDPDNGGAGQEPHPDSGTINGLGRCKAGQAECPQDTPLAVINVKQGQRYRMRTINNSGLAYFTFSIQNHDMTIIEADGNLHQPLVVSEFDIFVGQRYSFVLEANQPVDNYIIKAPMTVGHGAINPNLDLDNVFAILHYEGAPDPSTLFTQDLKKLAGGPPAATQGGLLDSVLGPVSLAPVSTPAEEAGKAGKLDTRDLVPLINPAPPGGNNPPDIVVDLEYSRGVNGTDSVAWMVNGIQFLPPNVPTLLQILAGNATVTEDFARNDNTIVLPRGKIVDIHIHGGNNAVLHPFHLHGHAFSVIRSGLRGGENYVNPPRRDVEAVGGHGAILRFVTDNPGPWIFHCHIDWHLDAGLAVVFAEDPEGIRDRVQPNQNWDELCPIYEALLPELQ